MPKSKTHYRVTYDDVLEAHQLALEFGGFPGILNADLIKSAIGRPYTGHYHRIYSKAAAIVQSLVKNHGFVDGNKRTAVFIADTLLKRSGYQFIRALEQPDSTELEDMVVAVANSRMEYDELKQWFKQRIVAA